MKSRFDTFHLVPTQEVQDGGKGERGGYGDADAVGVYLGGWWEVHPDTANPVTRIWSSGLENSVAFVTIRDLGRGFEFRGPLAPFVLWPAFLTPDQVPNVDWNRIGAP